MYRKNAKTFEDRFSGGSEAFKKFNISFFRTNLLKSVAIKGLGDHINQLEELVKKLTEAKEKVSTEVEIEEIEEKFDEQGNRLIKVTLEEEEFEFLDGLMTYTHKEYIILDTYLYSILVVFVWGAFETYITSLFSELFKLSPSMLKSSETIKYEELISNLDDPIRLLISKELNKIGHFKLKEYLDYLEAKLNIKLEKELETALKEIYLIRNIIAHNTGKVRDELVKLLPDQIKTIDNEIIVTNEYLDHAMKHINKSVNIIEKRIRESWFKED